MTIPRVAHVWWVGCISALLAAMRKACSSCSSLSSVASRAELHVAAVRQRTLLEGGGVGRPARSTRALVSCGRPRSRRRAASNPVRCAHRCHCPRRSPARSLPRLPRSPRCGGGTGAPWGLIPPADTPFPVPVVLVFVVAVFGLALVGCGGKARFWSYCWSSPCSSRFGEVGDLGPRSCWRSVPILI